MPRSRPPVQASTPALQDTHFNLTSVLKTPFFNKNWGKVHFQADFYQFSALLTLFLCWKISFWGCNSEENQFSSPSFTTKSVPQAPRKTRNAHTYQFFFRVPPPPPGVAISRVDYCKYFAFNIINMYFLYFIVFQLVKCPSWISVIGEETN